jgi:subtilisin family serine protease
VDQARSAPRTRSMRGLALCVLLTLTLGGTGSSRLLGETYLSYVVVADRADAEGAADAARAVRAAGGVAGPVHPQIGVAVAYATDRRFAQRLRRAPGIQAAGATRTVPLPAPPHRHRARPLPLARAHGDGPAPADVPPLVPDPGERPSWNLAMIGADRPAPAATPAALRHTVVAVLDSGVDDTHPDLRSAVDPARSVSCASGRADPSPGAWRPLPALPDNGHGTHIAGTIAAARDGHGITGVAPGVRVAAVRLLDTAGQYYAENIVCGFLWAADHGARVINNSYFADPWKYNCPDDPDQAAVTAAVARAVAYAQRRGALVVASAGNDGQDLGASRVDRRSPNDRTAATHPARHLGADCIRLPGELPGVVGVTAVDRDGMLAAYSNYGEGPGWLAAPGGDPDADPDGQIVSTWPGRRYAALSGTSMAAAHVSAAAALEAAAHPGAGPRRLHALLARSAVAPACPAASAHLGACPVRSAGGGGLVALNSPAGSVPTGSTPMGTAANGLGAERDRTGEPHRAR